MNEQT